MRLNAKMRKKLQIFFNGSRLTLRSYYVNILDIKHRPRAGQIIQHCRNPCAIRAHYRTSGGEGICSEKMTVLSELFLSLEVRQAGGQSYLRLFDG